MVFTEIDYNATLPSDTECLFVKQDQTALMSEDGNEMAVKMITIIDPSSIPCSAAMKWTIHPIESNQYGIRANYCLKHYHILFSQGIACLTRWQIQLNDDYVNLGTVDTLEPDYWTKFDSSADTVSLLMQQNSNPTKVNGFKIFC